MVDNTPTTAPAADNKPAKITQSQLVESVLDKVNEFAALEQIKLPPDYSPENAIKSSYLILSEQQVKGVSVLQHCTRASISKALLKMVTEGLSPMKQQGAFIPYGDKLTWQRQYGGNIALAKRFGKVRAVTGEVIYEEDRFEYEMNGEGRKKLVSHVQEFSNIDMNKIIGAYATVILDDGTTYIEVMNMAQIRQAWQQGATKGNSPAHKNFPDQMCKKTAINRACTSIIQSSDDAALYTDQDHEYDANHTAAKETAEDNTATIDVDFDEVSEQPKAVEAVPEPAPEEDKPAVKPNENFDKETPAEESPLSASAVAEANEEMNGDEKQQKAF